MAEYTVKQCIRALDRWLSHGETFFPIDAALSAEEHLRAGGVKVPPRLTTWLKNEAPNMSDELCVEVLAALRMLPANDRKPDA